MYENLSSMSLFTDDFLPRIFGVCSEADTFASYEVLGIAKIACVEERACIGVLDDACDNIGAFRLCKKGFVSPSASCVYEKKEYNGKSMYHYVYYSQLVKSNNYYEKNAIGERIYVNFF